MKINKRYNRIEFERSHFYLNNYGEKGCGGIIIYGYIKCKLVHAAFSSVILPDQVYFKWDNDYRWIQPYTFLPCLLVRLDDDIYCDIFFDISFGYTVKARFKADDLLRNYSDGSQLYKCELSVPEDVGEHAIGRAEINNKYDVFIELFHHTKSDTKATIIASSKLIGSKKNIQGTKELKNSEHVYLTPLHEIRVGNDLERIAMSSEEEIKLIRDNFNPPDMLFPGWEEKYKDDFLLMKVCRGSIENLTATLNFMVPVEYLSPQHVLKHKPINQAEYYEISAPFIQRIQVAKGGCVIFKDNLIMPVQSIIYHNFIIIGDATRLDGLKAPFDEENTTHTFKIEFLNDNMSMLEFWFLNANKNLFVERN